MTRAISVSELINKVRKLLDFTGEWLASFGRPEPNGSWLFWGDSGHGKTTFIVMLCKYLSRFGTVLYNSMEEGDSETLKQAALRVDLSAQRRKILFLNNESMDELVERLKRKKAPKMVVIDSIQYADLTYKRYKDLKKMFPNVLWIWISHENGKLPDGKVAQKIRFDANIKGRILGYKVFPVSRYGGNEPFVIWADGANKYHGSEF
jgi:uncharacterized protein YlbG (UPF0298 family)